MINRRRDGRFDVKLGADERSVLGAVLGELRELIVSRGATGFFALYRFLIAEDEVRILTLISQRELGFTP